jgi:toluene monooxygenase system protein E
MSAQRTYWHLASSGHKPSDYEIGSSELLYHTRRGLELQTPVTEFLRSRQCQPGLCCEDWERFDDPRSSTYASYVAARRDAESFLDALSSLSSGRDQCLAPGWLDVLDDVLGTLRYPVHGLQMISAFVGSSAPSGKIVITALLQTADEVRRIQRLTRRMCELRTLRPGLGDRGGASWQNAPHWQPLRELIERLLVVYDFGEALVVLEGLVKPSFDGLFVHDFSELARQAGDDVLDKLLCSLHEDCAWHAQWSGLLLDGLLRESVANRQLVSEWLERWRPRVRSALMPLLPVLSPSDTTRRVVLERRLEGRLRGHESWREVAAGPALESEPSP